MWCVRRRSMRSSVIEGIIRSASMFDWMWLQSGQPITQGREPLRMRLTWKSPCSSQVSSSRIARPQGLPGRLMLNRHSG